MVVLIGPVFTPPSPQNYEKLSIVERSVRRCLREAQENIEKACLQNLVIDPSADEPK